MRRRRLINHRVSIRRLLCSCTSRPSRLPDVHGTTWGRRSALRSAPEYKKAGLFPGPGTREFLVLSSAVSGTKVRSIRAVYIFAFALDRFIGELSVSTKNKQQSLYSRLPSNTHWPLRLLCWNHGPNRNHVGGGIADLPGIFWLHGRWVMAFARPVETNAKH